MISQQSDSADQTIDFAKKIARYVKPGDIFCLYGDLGAGKTTWVKGLVKGIHRRENRVNSPTFVLMNIYEGKIPVYHFDLYRIDASELINIGYEEFFFGEGVAVIEWSERLGDLLPQDHFVVELEHIKENKRRINIKATGAQSKKRLKEWVL